MENIVPPSTSGFTFPWSIGAGGSETPFMRNRRWYLYVWNVVEKAHYYYDYAADTFIPDKEWHEMA
jgi:hypothetical protein